MKILILHGPNLNLLGTREREIYGELTLEEINLRAIEFGSAHEIIVSSFQSNSEGELIDKLHESQTWADGVVFNPAAYTHTSVALHDAIKAIQIPVVEVHISNILSREDFRKTSLTAPACSGVISGFGWRSYQLGLLAVQQILEENRS